MFGERLKQLRQSRDLTQEDLAKRIGVTKQTISNWENGNITPALDVLITLVEFFHTTPNGMLGYQDPQTVDVSGLSENEIAHIEMLVQDMKELHVQAE